MLLIVIASDLQFTYILYIMFSFTLEACWESIFKCLQSSLGVSVRVNNYLICKGAKKETNDFL